MFRPGQPSSSLHLRRAAAWDRIRLFWPGLWAELVRLPRDLARDRWVLLSIDLTLLPWSILVAWKGDPGLLTSLGEICGIIIFYWLLFRKRPQRLASPRRPRLELAVGLVIVLVWMIYRTAEFWHVYTVPDLPNPTCTEMGDTILPKGLAFVIVPLVLLALSGYKMHWPVNVDRGAWAAALVVSATLVGWGLSHHSTDQLGGSTLCFYLGAGLPEELLFRALIQTRFEGVLRRPALALWLASFVFGLSHLPINLHGSFEHWPDALATAMTYQMGVGVALGYAYQRARSVLPLTFVHALIDSAP